MKPIDEHSIRARVPPWVESMGVPIWITDPAGCICYLNSRAEALFGHSLDEWLGRPCHLMVAGRTSAGAFCRPRCRVRAQADARAEIEPVRVEVTAQDGAPTEICVVAIAVESPAGRQLVHLVVDDERERRIRGFLDRLVGRRSSNPGVERRPRRKTTGAVALSPREQEVLSLLASDISLHEIAGRLGVSHTTVRNHVQHILAKLGVHSMLEAVAVSLIEEGQREGSATSSR